MGQRTDEAQRDDRATRGEEDTVMERRDLLGALAADHATLRSLMNHVEAARSESERNDAYVPFRAELLAHCEAEEATFYSALLRENAASEASAAAQQHQQVLDLLRELDDGLPPGDDDWSGKFRLLRELVHGHLADEERRLFDMARKALSSDALRGLASQFRRLKLAALENQLGPLRLPQGRRSE